MKRKQNLKQSIQDISGTYSTHVLKQEWNLMRASAAVTQPPRALCILGHFFLLIMVK